MIHSIKHAVIMTAMAIQGRNTQNSVVFCYFNKMTILEKHIHTFWKRQGPIVTFDILKQSK